MRRTFLLLLVVLLPMVASANDPVEINGIYYNLDSSNKTAQVTATWEWHYEDVFMSWAERIYYYSGDIVIPETVFYEGINYSVTSIFGGTYYNYRMLEYYSAFSDCRDLTSVTIPNSVTSIGNNAFYDCSGLTSVTIPNSVTSIGNNAFYGCSGLTSIKVASGNSKYDSRNDCNAIIETATNKLIAGCKNTVIPNSVTSIGEYAFYECSGLTSVTIPNSVTSIGNYAFEFCSGLTSVTIGNSVTSIGYAAFYGCSSLTSITIPNSVTSIGSNAFYYCTSLTSVIIPNSVTSIGDAAFYGCSGLTDFYCFAENVPSTHSHAFDSSPIASATLHVPAASIDAYKATSPWSKFGSIVPLTDDEIDGIEEIKDESLTPALSESEGVWYSLDGRQIVNGKWSNGKLPRGINIIRYSDGTSKKLLVK